MLPTQVDTENEWNRLYTTGGIMALTMVMLVLLDISISIMVPGGDQRPGELSTVEWFALFEKNTYHGLRNLGLLNILNQILGIPMWLALYASHRHVNHVYAELALILFLFGAVDLGRAFHAAGIRSQYAHRYADTRWNDRHHSDS